MFACGSYRGQLLSRRNGLTAALRKLAHAIYRDYYFFSAVKIENFIRKFLIFPYSYSNIDCGYTLVPPPRKNKKIGLLYPCKDEKVDSLSQLS